MLNTLPPGQAGAWRGVYIVRDKDGNPKFDDPHNVPQELLDALTEQDLQYLEALKQE